MLRTVFTTTGPSSFMTATPGLFDEGESSGHQVSCLLAVAGAVLDEQRRRTSARLAHAGECDWIALQWEFDATPQDVELQTTASVELLGGLGNCTEAKRSSRNFLVQKGFVKWEVGLVNVDEEIFVPPMVLGDETSKTLFASVLRAMGDSNVSPDALADNFGVVFLFLNFDAAKANLLLGDYLDERVPDNVVLLQTMCKMHALNRVTVDFLNRSELAVVNPVFSLSHLLHIGSYADAFRRAIVKCALEDFEWCQAQPPRAGDAEQHWESVLTCQPNLQLHRRRLEEVKSALLVLNGNWSHHRVIHHCTYDSERRPCCANEAQARARVTSALVVLLMSSLPEIPCMSRWLTCQSSFGWWCLGLLAHGIFPRAFREAWPEAADVPRLPLERLDADDGDNDEAANDDYKLRLQKRLRKAKQFLSEPTSKYRLALTMLILEPLHRCMVAIIRHKECAPGVSRIYETCFAINDCLHSFHDYLFSDPATGARWQMLQDLAEVRDEAAVMGIRRELHRVVGGLFKRAVVPMQAVARPANQPIRTCYQVFVLLLCAEGFG